VQKNQSICSIGESTPQASAMHSQLLGVVRAGLSFCHLLSPVVTWKQSSHEGWCSSSGGWPFMVKPDQGCTPTWDKLSWLNCGGSKEQSLLLLGVDKSTTTTTKGPLQWGFNGCTFHSFTHMASPGLWECMGVVRLMESLSQTQSLIFERVNPSGFQDGG
jgi:hypothetical protein